MIDQYNNAYLMKALNFNAEDMAANKDGRLTEAQKERLREKIGKGQTQAVIAMMLVLLISAGVIGFTLFNEKDSGLRQTFEKNPTVILIGLGGSFLLYLIIMGFALIRSQRSKAGNFKVMSKEGEVKLSSGQMEYGVGRAVGTMAGAQTRTCIIQIGREKIYTDEATFDSFVSGRKYRLYYVGYKPAYMIVSAEVVS